MATNERPKDKASEWLSIGIERAPMKGSSTVLEHKRRSKEQEQLHCHS